MRATALLFLLSGCGFGTMGNWVLESADDSFVLSEASVLAGGTLEDHRPPGSAARVFGDDTGFMDSDDEPAEVGLNYHLGFTIEYWSKQEDSWVRYGAGSMALHDASDGHLVDSHGLVMVIGRNDTDDLEGSLKVEILSDTPDGDYAYWFFNQGGDQDEYEWEEDDSPDNIYDQFTTVWTGGCSRGFRTLDCGEAVFRRPTADDRTFTPSDNASASDDRPDSNDSADTGSVEEDSSYWLVSCRGAPRVTCPWPKDLSLAEDMACPVSGEEGRTLDVRIRPSEGSVSVAVEGSYGSTDADFSFRGVQTPGNPSHYSGDCYGEVEEDGDEVNLSEMEWGGELEWHPG